MMKTEQSWQEIPIGLGWLVVSIVFMEILEAFDWIVTTLQPLTSILLSDTSIFSGWNRNAPFDTEAAKSLTAIFLLLVPLQIASVFRIPAKSICPRAQTKGVPAFATILAVFFLVQPLVFAWGLSINGPLRVFGKESSWGAAAAICVVTLSFAYAVRMVPVLLTMCGIRTQNKIDSSSA